MHAVPENRYAMEFTRESSALPSNWRRRRDRDCMRMVRRLWRRFGFRNREFQYHIDHCVHVDNDDVDLWIAR
jgi:hypothetical protein